MSILFFSSNESEIASNKLTFFHRHPETLPDGFSPYPGFISNIKDDFLNITIVLRKMIMAAKKRASLNYTEDI